MKKRFLVVACAATMAMGCAMTANAADATSVPYPAYFFDFENGYDSTGTSEGTANVVGSGAIESDTVDNATFGKVYHNDVAGTNKVRTNYLQLPDIMDTVIDAGNSEMTIGFWVNKADETDYFFTPIFSMYKKSTAGAKNDWPMFILQTRLLAQVNCSGYCDFADGTNDKKANAVDTTWLDDGAWHYYTATITKTHIKVYVDGVVKNSWTVDNTDAKQLEGLFSNYAKTDLNYVCLGGNQAWDWGDADASFTYDDVAIYTTALTQEHIQSIIDTKKNHPDVYVQYKAQDDGNYTIRVVAEVSFDSDVNTAYSGAGFRCSKQRSTVLSAESYLSTVVFKSVVAGGNTVQAADGKYFVVTEVKDVKNDSTLYVTPSYELTDTKAGKTFTDYIYTIDMANIIK